MVRTIRIQATPHAELADIRLSLPHWKREGLEELRLDLGAISLLSSIAIGELVRLILECRKREVKLSTCNVDLDVKRTLVHTGVGELLGIQREEPPSFESIVM